MNAIDYFRAERDAEAQEARDARLVVLVTILADTALFVALCIAAVAFGG